MFDIQRSFAAGELAPALWQRIDVSRVNVGLKTCKNFVVKKEGGVKYRHGSRYVATLKDASRKVRLVPFVFSNSITFILEFGHNYIRFYTNGQQVMSGLSPYEVATTYTEDEVQELDYEQSLDTITIVHKNHPPANLVRVSDTNWTLSDIVFNPGIMFSGAGNYPSTVTYFQQRRVFAATINKPETVWMSNTGVYTDFTVSSPVVDSDTIEFTIAGRKFNKVTKLIEVGGKFIVLTESNEWLIAGDTDGVVKPTAINAIAQSENGVTFNQPVVINGNLVYQQQRGSVWYTAAYNFNTDSVKSQDLTVFSQHLFFGHTFKSAAYQKAYDTVLWTVRDDGILVALTYLPDEDVWGWHQHDTAGTYENVMSVPEDGIDVIYAIVKRNGAKMLERFAAPSASSDVMDHWHVDAGLEYDGRNTGTISLVATSGGSWTAGTTMTLTSTSALFSASDVGNSFKIVNGTDVVYMSVRAFTSSTIVTVKPSKDVPTTLRGVPTTVWSRCVDRVSGLSHLEGMTVSVLADGSVETQAIVAGGAIDLARPFERIIVGLPYVGQIKTLDIDSNDQALLSNKKQIVCVNLFVEASRGLFAGTDYEHLQEFKQRTTETYGEPISLKTGTIEVNVPSVWTDSGELVIQQSDPLPLTILSINPEYRVSKL